MKYFFLILLPLFHQFNLYAQSEEITLENALENGIIKASFEGNSKSLHYVKPLKGVVSNTSKQKIKLLIETGSFFTNKTHQDILITMPLEVSLQVGEAKKIELFGIATQSNLPPPIEGANYSFQKTPKREWVTYAQFLAQEKLHGTAEAQYGLWVISEKQDIRKLMERSLRENIALKVRDFLVQMLRITENLDDLPRETHHKVLIDSNLVSNYTLPAERNSPECEVKGGGNFSLQTPKEVRLVMFDTKGVLVREIYYNPKEKAGNYKLRYGYDCSYYRDKTYVLSLVFDGKIHISTRLNSPK